MSKEVNQVIREARKQGLAVEQTRRHYRVFHPDNPARFVILPATPSDGRSLKNAIAAMRRELGFVWKGR